MARPVQTHWRIRDRAKRKAREASKVIPSQDVLRARDDFGFFCEFVTRNSPAPAIPAKHHLEWHKLLITDNDSRCLTGIAGDDIDLLAPRGSAKSTVLGLFVAWTIGNHAIAKKVLPILYISYSLNAARAKSATIKTIIESPEYQEIFPQVKKGKRWSDQYWSIDYKVAGIKSSGTEMFSMVCAGMAGSITSKRAALIIIDDPIKSSDQIASPQIREKMERNWNMVIKPTLLEGGRCICLGTRFRPDDIHCTIFSPARGWLQIEQSALIEDEDGNLSSYWEEMWSLDYLLKLKKEDPHSFSFQYMNIVQALESLGIERGWVQYQELPTAKFDSFVIGIDLASSLKQKSDYTVMMLMGVLGNKYYFIDYRRGKWMGNMDKLEALIAMIDDWIEEDTQVTVYVESVAYQASFKGDFIEYLHKDKKLNTIRCIPWRMKGDKLAHIMSVTGLYANNAVFYNKFIFHEDSPPIKEMVEFGTLPNDDCMDASVIALQGVGARRRIEAL